MKSKGLIKTSSIIFCAIFSVCTLVSSTIQLMQNIVNDSNLHILLRAGISLIAVIIMQVFKYIRFVNMVFTIAAQYIISMALVFILVWITGFIEPLARSAYRDIFLNFTVVFVCVVIVILIIEKRKMKKCQQKL